MPGDLEPVSLIGIGRHGGMLSRALRLIGKRVEASFHPQKDELSRDFGRVTSNWSAFQQASTGRPVLIAVPPGWNRRYLAEASEYAERIYVEKPIALTTDGWELWVRDLPKIPLRTGHIYRFFPFFQILAERSQIPEALRCRITYWKQKQAFGWRASTADNPHGVLALTATHFFDLAHRLCGPLSAFSIVAKEFEGLAWLRRVRVHLTGRGGQVFDIDCAYGADCDRFCVEILSSPEPFCMDDPYGGGGPDEGGFRYLTVISRALEDFFKAADWGEELRLSLLNLRLCEMIFQADGSVSVAGDDVYSSISRGVN